MPLSRSKAMYGAAYQIVFERCNPNNCTSPATLAGIKRIAEKILAWAEDQPDPQVIAAYKKAVPEIVKRSEVQLDNHIRYTQLVAARMNLPVPPV